MRYVRLFVAGLLLAGLAVVFSLKAEEGENLLPNKNGGFEKYKEGQAMPDGWIAHNSYPIKVTVMVDEALAHEGKVFLKLEQDADKSPGGDGAIYPVGGMPAKKGEEYEYTLWAKGRGTIYLIMYEAAEVFLGSSNGGAQELTPQWQKFTFIYKVDESANAEKLTGIGVAIHLKGVAYVDEVVWKKIKSNPGDSKGQL